PYYVDIRMKALDQHSQGAGAAADVENAVTRPKGRLIDERSSGPIAADQLYERVVERQEPIVASRGEISPAWFTHCFSSSRALPDAPRLVHCRNWARPAPPQSPGSCLRRS